MSIVDDFVANLVERNAVTLKGALTIKLVRGGIRVSGTVKSTLRDQKRNKDVLVVDVPVEAAVSVGAVVIPVPTIP
jgi:hypothetical protein